VEISFALSVLSGLRGCRFSCSDFISQSPPSSSAGPGHCLGRARRSAGAGCAIPGSRYLALGGDRLRRREALLGAACPLTVWEDVLRGRAASGVVHRALGSPPALLPGARVDFHRRLRRLDARYADHVTGLFRPGEKLPEYLLADLAPANIRSCGAPGKASTPPRRARGRVTSARCAGQSSTICASSECIDQHRAGDGKSALYFWHARR